MKIFILFLIFSLFTSEINAQTGELIGSVNLPTISKKKRTFRGRVYRNRLAGKAENSQEDKSVTSFENVIVSAHPISFKSKVKPLKENVKVLQKNKEFIPKVVAVTKGSTIEFINNDNFYHNVFSLKSGDKFNIGRRPTGEVVKRKIETSGEIKIFCDIHSQMSAVILSFETPYFTNLEADGKFNLDLPKGKYEIQIYHSSLPLFKETIEIKANQKLEKNFTLSN
ncbi:MAG: hypothetical protein DWQ06_08560 [Calditrichaeota bacterium]|nr:MAG: hypothetical protein DWQ06_08560 [Calditrichota bacterium]